MNEKYIGEECLETKRIPKKNQGGLRVSMRWKPDGEQIIKFKLSEAKIVAEPAIFMKMLHIFYYGSPEYEPDSIDEPNGWGTNWENYPPKLMKL